MKVSPTVFKSGFLTTSPCDKPCVKTLYSNSRTEVLAWKSPDSCSIPALGTCGDSTYFAYVYEGCSKLERLVPSTVQDPSSEAMKSCHSLLPRMYFCCPPNKFTMTGGSGLVIRIPVAVDSGMIPFFMLGGPVEDSGRLPYIDGGTDSLILPPVMKGAPCLNSIHYPPNVEQTIHTHPSDRVFIVLDGRGTCYAPKDTPGNEQETTVTSFPGKSDLHGLHPIEVQTGDIVVIPANVRHGLFTDAESTLDIVVFHPDSDFGPTPDNHPMVNRTLVDGVSAVDLPSIRTKQVH